VLRSGIYFVNYKNLKLHKSVKKNRFLLKYLLDENHKNKKENLD